MSTSERGERDLAPLLRRFVDRLRAVGIVIGTDRLLAFHEAVDALGAGDVLDVVIAGRVTLCGDPVDLARYDAVAREVFAGLVPDRRQAAVMDFLVASEDRTSADVPPSPGDEEESRSPVHAANASRTERLRHRDIALLTDDERAELRRILAAFRLPGDLRRTRRHRRSHRGGIDRHATVRRLLRSGGEPAVLARRRPRTRPRPVVLLVDVSGSMAAHADALLRFAHATTRGHAGRTEVFTLGTRLTRVTRELSARDPDVAMRALSGAVEDWGGGTRLGETLRAFLDQWGQRGTARGAVVVVLSDGWERDDPALLGEQVARLGRLAHRVVWANPRAGRDGFAPTAAGMAAVLPHCDALVPITSLAGLEALARTVAGTTGPRHDVAGTPTPGEELVHA